MSDLDIKKAIDDLNLIKRILERSDSGGSLDRSAIFSNVLLYGVTLSMALYMLFVETFFDGPNMSAFLYSKYDANFLFYGLLSAGVGLIVMSVAFVLVVGKASSIENKDFDQYVLKNFSYLKRQSFFYDLLIKFSVFALLIYAGKPEWVPVLFTIFTADYLFQGRFFRLPFRTEILLGCLTFAAGVLQFSYFTPSLVPSLVIFSVVTAVSLGYAVYEGKSASGSI